MRPRVTTGILTVFVVLAIASAVFASQQSVAAQEGEATATLRPEAVYITVTYNEPINVRGGPNSVYYNVVGSLAVGATAQATGKSLGGEWLRIVFPGASDGSGVGWVYSALVTVSGGFLPVVEPPPTAVPGNLATLDPSFAASLVPEPTATRPATFTAPAPLIVPTYTSQVEETKALPPGLVITILGAIGIIGMLANGRRRRR